MKTKTTPATATPDVRADLAKTLHSEQLAVARANLDRLQADLADAKITADAAEAQHRAAAATWQRAEDAGVPHTQEQAERLTRLHSELVAAKNAVADLEQQIADCEYILSRDEEAAARARRIALAEALWPPMVKKLLPLVRQMHAALEEQAKVRDQLIEAGAWGLVNVEDLALPDALYTDPSPTLTRWLAAAERAGYRA